MNAAQHAAKVALKHQTRDPFTICNDLGILVLRHYLSDLRGYFRVSNGQIVIVLSDDLSAHTSQFVCAHELGHYLLHKGLNRVFMDTCTYMVVDKYENEADKFAANLLFSEPPLYYEQTLSNWEMADCLNVPVCNVDMRLIELGIYH